nr:hypothetical protein [Candidatus Sigynarchaeota archaeon]
MSLNVQGNLTALNATTGKMITLFVDLADEYGNPMVGVNVTYAWAGGIGLFTDQDNGTYVATIEMPRAAGIYPVTINAFVSDDYSASSKTVLVSVQQPQLSPESILANTIAVIVIIGLLFFLLFFLYLRPKLVKRRLTRYEEVKTCTVHKGPIKEGLTYVCPTCASIYCTKCAQALFNNNDPCWVCATPIAPFAVSYEDDWTKNLQYLFLYQRGMQDPIHEQAIGSDEAITVPEILQALKKSISQQVLKHGDKKKDIVDVQEYFNSKILFYQGEFITMVMVSRIDSSFIRDKMKEFVEEFELLFYDAEKKTWRGDARDKYVTKTKFLLDKLFSPAPKEEIKDEGKGKKGAAAKQLDEETLRHKVRPWESPDATKSEKEREEMRRKKEKEKAYIPVQMPEPRPESAVTEEERAREVQRERALRAAMKRMFPAKPAALVEAKTEQPAQKGPISYEEWKKMRDALKAEVDRSLEMPGPAVEQDIASDASETPSVAVVKQPLSPAPERPEEMEGDKDESKDIPHVPKEPTGTPPDDQDE